MLADILICLVLIAIVTSIVHSLIKNKKQARAFAPEPAPAAARTAAAIAATNKKNGRRKTAVFHGRQRASVSRSGATYF